MWLILWLASWLRNWRTARPPAGWAWRRPSPRLRPRLEALEERCLLSAGQLDPTFGVGGKALTNVQGPTVAQASAVAVSQPDGKIIVVGSSKGLNNSDRTTVVRYNADGSLDAGFGSGGKATFDHSSGLDLSASSVTLDASGRILVAGSSLRADNYHTSFAVIRISPNGTPDTSFGAGGKATVAIDTYPYGGYDRATGVAVDGLDRIILAGRTYDEYSSNGFDFAVTRLSANGSLDTGFGSGGKTTINFAPYGLFNDGSADFASGVALDSLGRIVVVGSSYTSTSPNGLAVARLEGDGALDAGFGTGGTTTVHLGTNVDAGGNRYPSDDVANAVAMER